jgi:hypothetical protein
MTPLYISFFTPSYESEAKAMERSCREFGLATDVRALPSLGDWTRNCGQKPVFIREMMKEYEGWPLVWLDADARVRQYPELFDNQWADFAAHWRHGSELLSGTMYFGPTPKARELVEVWCEAQAMTPDDWDQRVLSQVIELRAVPGLVIRHLPAQYTAVWDDPKMGNDNTWVISHHQASRRLAKAV